MRLFLDCDGVLADFDAGAAAVLGMSAAAFQQRFGAREFWRRLAQAPEFYATLPEMADARLLFDPVAQLRPTILTGLPMGNWAAPQKIRWAEQHFPGVPVITCMARDKHRHMARGDVLVDDRENHRAAYEQADVIFVHHVNAKGSLMQLAKLFPEIGVVR